MTVSIRAARTIRWISAVLVGDLDELGALELAGRIAGVDADDRLDLGERLERLSEPAAPVARQAGDQNPAAVRALGDDLDPVAHPSQTDLRRATISWRFSWIRARTSCATDWTSALSSAGSEPIRVVSIGSRKRILNFAGR